MTPIPRFMKKLCFNIVAWSGYALIYAINYLYALSANFFTILVSLLRTGIAKFSVMLMKQIDAEAYQQNLDEEAAARELEKQSAELELLSNATKLKEHALETGEWTEEHSEALNAIGNALLNSCDWDEDDIHQYLKEVVESGTGLFYERGEGDEYDD